MDLTTRCFCPGPAAELLKRTIGPVVVGRSTTEMKPPATRLVPPTKERPERAISRPGASTCAMRSDWRLVNCVWRLLPGAR